MAGISTSIQINDGLSAVFKNMTNAINICLSSFETMQMATGESVNVAQFDAARVALHDMNYAAQSFTEGIAAATEQQERMNQSIRAGSSATDGMLHKIMGVASAYMGIHAIGGIFNTADELTQTTARLNLIVDDGGSVEELQNQIFASAQRARGSYLTTADAVSKMGMQASQAFTSNNELITFTELLNKQFVNSGTAVQGVDSVILQLTQSMAAGKLQGEELNAILDNATPIVQDIQRYLEEVQGIDASNIKELASEGVITSDVIKNAMFYAADEINEKFESMPMTWAQVGTGIENMALRAFQPFLQAISAVTQMEEFETVTNGIISGFAILASVAVPTIQFLIDGAAFIAENWNVISPIIYGVAIAFGIYEAILLANNISIWAHAAATSADSFAQTVHTAKMALQTGVTFRATVAQYGLNAALLACPLTWIVIAIIAVIAIIYVAVAAINNAKDTSISATGIIAGAFAVLGAHIINMFVVPTWNMIAAFVNFFGNVFNDPVGAVEVLFYDMCLTVMGFIRNLAQGIEDLLNKIPGVTIDITSGLDSFYRDLEQAQQAVKDERGWVEYVKKLEYIDYGDAAKAGYNFGEGIDSKVKSMFNTESLLGDMTAYEDMGYNAAVTADNTGKMADSIEISEEDLKYMRDIAEREVIDRTVFSTITVDMGGVTNTVQNINDLDAIPQYLADTIQEQMDIGAEGVHTDV